MLEGFLDILKSIFFGIVEGITEWLPVSSTGHLIIFEEFLEFSFDNVNGDFWNLYSIVIQLGAIMAVVTMFWSNLFPFKFSGGVIVKKSVMTMWYKVLVSCVPAAVIGLLLDELLEKYLYNWVTVAIMLILFGVFFIIIENRNKNAVPTVNSISEITYKQALIIGAWQVLAAALPGTSRSGATIIGALLLGLSRKTAAEFTFYLAVPVMFGASLLKLIKCDFAFTPISVAALIVGMIVSYVVSILVIKFLLGYIRKHDFKVFGWYRIALGIIVILFFILKPGA
ncbi:MAG: undecaprenyl-diphosphate phosphatase [Clostridia bacterium]|nr:undecaprenyl-diphosphate phosphatase [Clostridia bacterium]